MVLVPLAEATGRCGTKADHLARLIRAGFPVPNGFAVPDPSADPAWADEMGPALRQLGPGPFAVRSSGPAEDGPSASFAGQFVTVLGVTTRDGAVEAVRRVAASGRASGARWYAARARRGVPASVPVIVQAMVSPDAAGVLFSRHPSTGADQVVIDAARGLGEPVVAGTVTPETYVVTGARVEVTKGRQEHRVDVRAGELVTTQLTPGGRADHPVLTTTQALALAETARRIVDLFGCPQDIEWATVGDQVWVLQARPITTPPGPAGSGVPTSEDVLLTGIAASPGVAVGPVRLIAGLDDFPSFADGDVLVCRTTSPSWTPLLARACAVVTETGGLLAHAAIVAREFGIPAVLAATEAMTTLDDGREVRVDGTHGQVAGSSARR